MGRPVGSLVTVHNPEATITANLTTTPKSLEDFGFDAAMVSRSARAFIYVHTNGALIKFAQDYPPTAATGETNPTGYRAIPTYTAPVPAAANGHGIAAGQEREVVGANQLQLLRMISANVTSVVTITLES